MTSSMATKEATQPTQLIVLQELTFFNSHICPEPEIEADETEHSSDDSATDSDAVNTSEETEAGASSAFLKAHIYSFW